MELVPLLKFHPAYISKYHNEVRDVSSFEVEPCCKKILLILAVPSPASSSLLTCKVIQFQMSLFIFIFFNMKSYFVLSAIFHYHGINIVNIFVAKTS